MVQDRRYRRISSRRCYQNYRWVCISSAKPPKSPQYSLFNLIFFPDRKKDLVKLQAGEYVSLGKVETQLKTCSVVENICVYGDARKDYTVALIVPNPIPLKEIGEKYGFDKDASIDQLCEDSRVEREVLHQIVMHGKKCKNPVIPNILPSDKILLIINILSVFFK